ncbi:MAG: 1-phosphofructokinase [Acidaminococcus sp.]|jgi:1-phosphofructokinase|nr:1-phosphofructokinase [Acidaminococcus sp.]
MIYTVTFNPSLDYVVTASHFTIGNINRSVKEEIFPGGKGINVSIMLQNLDIKSRVLGFKAGFTGDEIERLLKKRNLDVKLLPVKKGFSRINVKIRGDVETALNGKGPEVGMDDIAALVKEIATLDDGDILVLSGSRPANGTDALYADIVKMMNSRGVRCVVDATGDLLKCALPCHPFLVKPNREEMEEILGEKLPTKEDIADGAREMQKMGARNILVSLGGEGALLLDENNEVHFREAPHGTPVNTVGAGDSMVAGFLAGYLKYNDYEKALLWGISAGSATAFTMHLADKEAIEAIIQKGE